MGEGLWTPLKKGALYHLGFFVTTINTTKQKQNWDKR